MSGFRGFLEKQSDLDESARLGGTKRFTSQRLPTGFYELYICATDNPETPIALVYKGNSEHLALWTVDEAQELVRLLRVATEETNESGRVELVGLVPRTAGPDVRVEVNRWRAPIAITNQSRLSPRPLKFDRRVARRLIAFLSAAIQVAISPQDTPERSK